jgi:hypothetical protein
MATADHGFEDRASALSSVTQSTLLEPLLAELLTKAFAQQTLPK